jgi:hypothetical protein
MRRHLFELLCALLILSALFFFFQALRQLAQRDYVASGLLTLIGVSTMQVGTYLGRLALSEGR